ncbi:hypothetical protein [Klenkia brasiliensis]|uniref:Uncharacterized protein n=1 Tax=Klenkia brasiliensis TaxID=333142 RepID=A0A1G7YI97_9ACTN|nr:hypothetical protein [Klenkia brasiliensis]SDG96104.1 hypothetical protein SAMN05660324_3968 [Klenkia brasiliensis]
MTRLTRDGSRTPGDRFEVLRYRGDLSEVIRPGQILGADGFGRPYEVLDTEVDPVLIDGHHDGDGCLFPTPGHLRPQTTVHLQYATVETLTAGVAELQRLLGGAR